MRLLFDLTPSMRRWPALLCLSLASLLWGSTWIFTQTLSQSFSSMQGRAWTLLVAGIAAGLASVVVLLFERLRSSRDTAQLRFHREWFLRSALFGAAMLALPAILVAEAAAHSVNGWIPLLYSAMPLFCAFASGRWSTAMLLAIGATFAVLGGTVVFRPAILLWTPLVIAAVAVQIWALRLAARLFQRSSMREILGSLAVQCFVAATILWCAAHLLEPAAPFFAQAWTSDTLIALFALALGCTAAAYALFYAALRFERISIPQAAVTQWLQLAISVIESAFFVRVLPLWSTRLAVLALLVCAVLVLKPGASDPEGEVPFRITPMQS